MSEPQVSGLHTSIDNYYKAESIDLPCWRECGITTLATFFKYAYTAD